MTRDEEQAEGPSLHETAMVTCKVETAMVTRNVEEASSTERAAVTCEEERAKPSRSETCTVD